MTQFQNPNSNGLSGMLLVGASLGDSTVTSYEPPRSGSSVGTATLSSSVMRALSGPSEAELLVKKEFESLSKSVEMANEKITASKKKRWAWGFKTTV